jgi:predicted LPLAT superfamily acyltransferase
LAKSLIFVYKNYYIFGQTLIDKIAVLSGLDNKFTYSFSGKENLTQIIKGNKGGILISAHIGNWELAAHVLKEITTKINIVVYEDEHVQIKNYLDTVMKDKNFNFIIVNKDKINHIYEINAALERNEFICIHGDRFVEGSKTTSAKFLGENASFPIGPFLLGSQLRSPISFVYSIKERNNHYHFYASTPIVAENISLKQEKETQAINLLNAYVQSLEQMVLKYPTQWFNYYHFWKS